MSIKAEYDELARISLEKGASILEIRKAVDLAIDTFVPNEGWMF